MGDDNSLRVTAPVDCCQFASRLSIPPPMRSRGQTTKVIENPCQSASASRKCGSGPESIPRCTSRDVEVCTVSGSDTPVKECCFRNVVLPFEARRSVQVGSFQWKSALVSIGKCRKPQVPGVSVVLIEVEVSVISSSFEQGGVKVLSHSSGGTRRCMEVS